MAPNFPISHTPTTIAIVGGGFSGSLVAANLLKTATRPLIIKLIERSHDIGKGVAYSTDTNSHLLNVSAGNMSAFPDDPAHLMRWLNYNRSELATLLPDEINASIFIPRQIYGLYIQSILEEAEATAASSVRLERLIDEVVAVEPEGKGAIVSLRSSRHFLADKIVLSLGNSPSTPLGTLHVDDNDERIRDAWSANALVDLEPDAPVLLIGTGLTMVDMVVSLHERQHRGQIYAVSRRGLFPLRHQATKPYPAFLNAETAPKTIRDLWRRVRVEVEAAAMQGYDWRAVIDALRPMTQQLWQQLPCVEQQRFLRHVKPYWEVHRHRIAPRIGDVVHEMLDSGQLKVLTGRIQDYQALPEAIAVTVRQRQTQTTNVLSVSCVVNCTGVEADYRRSSQPLLANLRSQGLIRPNEIGLGLDTASRGAVLDANGNISTLLYTLGTPRKGDLWETTAVPELREQAQVVSEAVLQSLPVRVRPVSTISRSTRRIEEGSISQGIGQSMLFRQFFDQESSTYTYLIADRQTRDAVLVDAVLEQVDRDLQSLDELKLTLRYCLETHIHADHITGAGKLRQQTGCRIMVPQNATVSSADRSLADGETLVVGSVVIQAIATPGHTQSHMAYLINSTHLLTGDALLIRGCGRTDFQEGDAGTLYDSVTQRLFTLPDDTLVYPAHDYKGCSVSTIGEEKRLNPRFANRSRTQFITIMSHLGLSYPKKMKEAVPANEYCGDFIPQANLSDVMSSAIDKDREKVELTLSTNTEIYNDYFAMYI
ncbi:MAG: FAD/NAD(P)-binding protein [Chroococcidiopsidaceae cyanobacterium CP_BM_ER_R8_30]|nr:FAD/NAD(P)-binding protein [Chroococcidiopsidaceae cyanobacterium CP_BM_ER_R8_30]